MAEVVLIIHISNNIKIWNLLNFINITSKLTLQLKNMVNGVEGGKISKEDDDDEEEEDEDYEGYLILSD